MITATSNDRTKKRTRHETLCILAFWKIVFVPIGHIEFFVSSNSRCCNNRHCGVFFEVPVASGFGVYAKFDVCFPAIVVGWWVFLTLHDFGVIDIPTYTKRGRCDVTIVLVIVCIHELIS